MSILNTRSRACKYAFYLIKNAKNRDESKIILENLKDISFVFCNKNINLNLFFKQIILDSSFISSVNYYILQDIKLLLKLNDILILPSIYDIYKSLFERKYISFDVYLPQMMSKEYISRIVDFGIRSFNVNLDRNYVSIYIDKSLIGGFIIQCFNMSLDCSLKRTLSK